MALLVLLASAALLAAALLHRPTGRTAPRTIDLVALEREPVVEAEVVASWRRPATPLQARYADRTAEQATGTRRWSL